MTFTVLGDLNVQEQLESPGKADYRNAAVCWCFYGLTRMLVEACNYAKGGQIFGLVD